MAGRVRGILEAALELAVSIDLSDSWELRTLGLVLLLAIAAYMLCQPLAYVLAHF